MAATAGSSAGLRLHAALDASIRARVLTEQCEVLQQVSELECWQKQRLATTYEDLAASKQHCAATEFFRSDLYAPPDLDQRDLDVRRMVPIMLRLLPESAIATIATAIELQALTLELDLALVSALGAVDEQKVTWTHQSYARAYRKCDNREQRERQIKLIVAVGKELDQLVRNPLIRAALRVARGPAAFAGISTLHSFLERGFAAFRAMRSADYFLSTIERRERKLMDAILSGSEDPFANLR